MTNSLGHLLEVLQPLDRVADGLEIGQHAAEPAVADERHAAALGLGADRLAAGPLGADEQDLAAVGRQRLDEGIGLARERQALLEVDDVDFVTFAEDVGCHLRVPVTGLMTEMHASL